jgi:hypothetical protein
VRGEFKVQSSRFKEIGGWRREMGGFWNAGRRGDSPLSLSLGTRPFVWYGILWIDVKLLLRCQPKPPRVPKGTSTPQRKFPSPGKIAVTRTFKAGYVRRLPHSGLENRTQFLMAENKRHKIGARFGANGAGLGQFNEQNTAISEGESFAGVQPRRTNAGSIASWRASSFASLAPLREALDRQCLTPRREERKESPAQAKA